MRVARRLPCRCQHPSSRRRSRQSSPPNARLPRHGRSNAAKSHQYQSIGIMSQLSFHFPHSRDGFFESSIIDMSTIISNHMRVSTFPMFHCSILNASAYRLRTQVFSPARLAFALRRHLFARAEPRDPDDDGDDDADSSSASSSSTAMVVRKPKPKKKGAVAATAMDLVAMSAASLEVCLAQIFLSLRDGFSDCGPVW
jgi:hypothetical protein